MFLIFKLSPKIFYFSMPIWQSVFNFLSRFKQFFSLILLYNRLLFLRVFVVFVSVSVVFLVRFHDFNRFYVFSSSLTPRAAKKLKIKLKIFKKLKKFFPKI